jgi:hypothetical protein
VPTTLVTYKVNQVFHGPVKVDSLIRLRFLGGPLENGGFLQLPYMPTFEKGDQDVLFVAGNGTGDCPLVECVLGRVKGSDGFLYNDALGSTRIALTWSGEALYLAQKPIDPSDVHTFGEYRQRLSDILSGGGFSLKTINGIHLDARDIKYTPPQ